MNLNWNGMRKTVNYSCLRNGNSNEKHQSNRKNIVPIGIM